MHVRHDGAVLVHDYLTQRGGAERVVLALAKALPGAPLVTSLYQPDQTFPDLCSLDIRTGPLQHLGVLRRHHRIGLPVYAPAFSACHIDAPLTLCSTSGWAHGVHVTGRKVLYVYTPARWLYDAHGYLGERHRLVARGLVRATAPLRSWDHRAARSADRVLAISMRAARRIRDVWGLDAEVLHPPHAAVPEGPAIAPPGIDGPGFLLLVARLLPYKAVDVVLAAMEELSDHYLVVVGDGPERARLEQLRPRNAMLLGRVGDAELRWLFLNCLALVSAATEDFGLSALEAMAYGKPVVVLRAGGFEETVVEGETGVFFDVAEPAAVAVAVRRAMSAEWDRTRLCSHASRFCEEAFVQRVRDVVAETL